MFTFQKNFFSPTQPVDEAQFYALVRDMYWNQNIDQYRQTGDAALKRRLPAFIFQASFDETVSKAGKKGCWRKQAATRLTGLVVMDIDHVEEPRAVYDSWSKSQDLKALGILLVYVTPSGKGLKVVFKADAAQGNLIDNQHQMAEKLGVQVDESCKDASRMSFICKEDDILFIDKELFTYENKEFAEKYNAEYRNGHSGSSPKLGEGKDPHEGSSDPQPPNLGGLSWRGYDVQSIIDARYGEKLPCAADSNRHAESLKLATDLLIMLDSDRQRVQAIVEAQPWVKEIMRERNENVQQTVASAAECVAQKEKRYGAASLSKIMLKAVETATHRTYHDIVRAKAQKETVATEDGMAEKLWRWGEQIETLSADFPILKDVTKGLKPNQYPAALFVAGGLMMTLMTRCTYRFYHRPEELRRLNNSTLIIGDPASGKSFATRLYKLLAAPIIAADQIGKEAINAYRETMKTKGANKEKPKKPKAVVRVHPARTSNAQFIQDMVNAVEVVDGKEMQLHMLTFDTELDNTLTVQKGGSWIDKQSLQLKAFHNEEDGQAYSNVDSIMQDFYVVWNYIYTGTPIALKKMVNEQNFGSGLATRLTCIPLPATNFEMIDKESNVDTDSDERLSEAASLLDKTKGLLPMQKIVDELYEWTSRRMADAKDNDSRADEMLLKRCAYHGVNFAAPFIVLRHWTKMHQDGDYYEAEFQTDDTDWLLAELIVNIQYACQRHFFGALAETYFDNKSRDAAVYTARRQKTIEAFSRLPKEFTLEDVMRCYGFVNVSSSRVKIHRLMRDKLIEKKETVREDGQSTTVYIKTGMML